MSAHTPGPWVTDGHIYGGERVFTYPDNTGYQVCAVACHSKEGEANARLIAAAPELLAALTALLAEAEAFATAIRPYANSEAIAASRAVIAKAKGESV